MSATVTALAPMPRWASGPRDAIQVLQARSQYTSLQHGVCCHRCKPSAHVEVQVMDESTGRVLQLGANRLWFNMCVPCVRVLFISMHHAAAGSHACAAPQPFKPVLCRMPLTRTPAQGCKPAQTGPLPPACSSGRPAWRIIEMSCLAFQAAEEVHAVPVGHGGSTVGLPS